MLKKLFAIKALAVILFANDVNVGFVSNQKYVCIQEYQMNAGKLSAISDEEKTNYPSRFYVDDNMILHTDGKTDNTFYYNKDLNLYISEYSAIELKILENKRYMIRSFYNTKFLTELAILHFCIETDNWTLVR